MKNKPEKPIRKKEDKPKRFEKKMPVEQTNIPALAKEIKRAPDKLCKRCAKFRSYKLNKDAHGKEFFGDLFCSGSNPSSPAAFCKDYTYK